MKFLLLFLFVFFPVVLFVTAFVDSVQEVRAHVEAVGVTHGATGSGKYLVCILENGQRVNVFLGHSLLYVSKGKRVTLCESSHAFSSRKTYDFVGFDSSVMKKVRVD